MSFHRSIDARIQAIAGTQFGIITTRQLRRAGVGASATHRRIRAGLLRPLFANVYAVGPIVITCGDEADASDAWQMAAVLHGGSGAALSHSAAAARMGAWARWNRTIHVTAPHRVHVAPGSGVVYHRSASHDAGAVIHVAGIPTTSAERMVFDLGTELTAFQICSVIRELVFLDRLDLRRVDQLLLTHWGNRGTAVVRKAIRLYREGSAGTRSASEDRLLAAILSTSLPEPLVNNRSLSVVDGVEPDFAWPEARLIVEIDGRTSHGQPGNREQDRRRDLALERAGWTVIRIDAQSVWQNTRRVLDLIVAAYLERVRVPVLAR